MTEEENGERNDEEVSLDSLVVDFVEAMRPRTNFARDMLMHADTLRAAGNALNLQIAAQSRALIHNISPYLLAVKPDWNARDHDLPDNRKHVLNLAQSIAVEKVKEPLTVYSEDDQIFISNGHCRFLAVMHVINVMGIEVSTVPIKFEDSKAKEDDRIASQVVRNSGKPLEPLEMARVCKRLVSHGWEIQRIAGVAGVTRGRVVQLLDLHAKTTPKIEKMIRSGEVKPSFAARVIRAAGQSEKAEDLLEEAVANAKKEGKSKASEKHLPRPLADIAAPTRDEGSDSVTGAASDTRQDASVGTGFVAAPAVATETRAAEPLTQPLRRIARDIFRRASIVEGDDGVTIHLSPDDYATLRTVLGIQL